MQSIILYIHILAASAWIGGSILLFGIGVYFKEKEVQNTIYHYIGPFYGYFERVWLSVLLFTGGYLFVHNNLYEILGSDTVLTTYLWYKMIFVSLIVISTVTHMYISLKAHGRERSMREKLISRATSMSIFLLNLLIIWAAMNIRDYM